MNKLKMFFNPNDGFLNCGLCNKPLSVQPIFHTPTLGNICGRCEDKGLLHEGNEDSKLSRQKIYEKIASRLEFPCAYRVFGCDAELRWNSVSDHEADCKFKNVICPLSNEKFRDPCLWAGLFDDLENHIKKDHKTYFSKLSQMQLSITREYESKILFWEVFGHVVMMTIDYKEDLKKYYCSIVANLNRNDCQLYQCRVEISTNRWENPLLFEKPALNHWYGNTVAKPENSIQINVSSFESMFEQSEELIFKFIFLKNNQEITSESNDVLNVLTRNDEENRSINEDLLPDLECPICVEYMAPPIFICQSGHNVCSSCSKQIDSCPLCRGPMCGGRNFILEKLTATIKYPCMNRSRGCGYVSELNRVKEHEGNCLLSETDCVKENCSWKGTNVELFDHIEKGHTILQMKTVYNHESSPDERQHFLIFDDKIFLFSMKFEINKPLEYYIQCLGNHEVKYKHELQIIGCSAFDIRVTLGHLCQPKIFTKRGAKEPTKISIPFDFLCQFFTQFRQLEYKINIKRIDE